MALVGALSSLRASVLRHISVPTQSAAAQQSLGAACSLICRRGFAEGTYLDKNQVTDRVLEVTKNFGSKVDSGKVSPSVSFKELGLDSLDTVEVVMAYEEEFGIEIPDSEADKIQSTADAIAFIASHPQAK